MNPAAAVHSIPALQDFYNALCIFRNEGHEALSSVAVEIRRADQYLTEQHNHWRREVKLSSEEVAQAKLELARKKFPGFDGRVPDCTLEERNLRRAQHRLDHAERQVEVVRSWMNRLAREISEVYETQEHNLSNFLEGDLARGLAMLERRLQALERYVAMAAPSLPPPPPPPTEPTS